MRRVILSTAVVLVSAAAASADLRSDEVARLQTAARVVHDIRASIPSAYWDRAHCVAVVPELKKAAFIIGGEYGKGVMSCRAGDGWSAPVFLELAKGSWGFQAGAEQVDVVLLVMNESGVQKLLQNNVTLGADASVAAGPVGRQGQIGTDAYLSAEILSYSRAQGLFAGIDLSGGVLRPDEEANRDAYGGSASPRMILAMRPLSAPTEATAFIDALGSTGAPAPARDAQPSRRVETAPPATVPPTTDSDIRAQLVAIQQSLANMMSEKSAPVGTSGAADTNATITVSRARLEQLRAQVDQLLKELDRR